MNYKKLVFFMTTLILIMIILLIGRLADLWQFGVTNSSLCGLVAIIPAVVWIFFKGVNFINSPLYFAGLAFVIYKNFFNSFAFGFVIICLVFALAAVIMPIVARLNKDQLDAHDEIKEG